MDGNQEIVIKNEGVLVELNQKEEKNRSEKI